MFLWLIIFPPVLFTIVIAIFYWKQDAIVQELISTLNEDFKGKVEIGESHVSPFENFPYISIDAQEVKIFEDKIADSEPIVHLKDCYLGFGFF